MQPVKFYFDVISQPCRALYILFEAAKIPYEPKPVNLLKGEHLTDTYRKNANRFQKVPAINDQGFQLSESVAILRHLNREKLVPEHWYPHRSLCRSRIDEYMEWQHGNMRSACSEYFQIKWLSPHLYKSRPNDDTIHAASQRLEKVLSEFENNFLNSNKFLVGRNVSLADLLAICEIDQPKMIGYDPFKNRVKLRQWYHVVQEALGPFYKDVINAFAHRLKTAAMQKEAVSLKQ